MSDDPYIDFDGDGSGDEFETATTEDGTTTYTHYDDEGNVDAVAYDYDGDGIVEDMDVDTNGDGNLDTYMWDDNGDGIIDEEVNYGDEAPADDSGSDPAVPEQEPTEPVDGVDTASAVGQPLGYDVGATEPGFSGN